jgi:hypothetical protein
MPAGRPTTYNEETANEILERIVQGESLRSIVKDAHMPVISTVFRWMSHNEEFSKQYTRAKEEQAEAFADEIVAIADEEQTVVKSHDGGTTEVTFDSVAIARNRLRVDARKWVASKLKPKKYGDKIDHDIKGAMTVIFNPEDADI